MAVGFSPATRAASPVRWRRNAQFLTPDQASLLREAFTKSMAVNDDRGYQYFAGVHGLPMPIGCSVAHGTPYFLPWHRAYLYSFERSLMDLVPTATLPWWDWTVHTIPDIYTAENAPDNPLASAPVDPRALQQAKAGHPPVVLPAQTVRFPGQPGSPPLPTATDVADLLEITDFLDFTSQLENLHNNVHVWTGGDGGDMYYIYLAAFDPIFWAHHAMVDRIWRIWQQRHSGANPPADILDDALPPFGLTVRQTLNVTTLGYDYAVTTASVEVDSAPAAPAAAHATHSH